MKLSLNWLKDLVNLEGINEDELAQMMVKAGFEIEGIEHLGSGDKLIVGEVIECEDHPDSDHLHVTKVNIGNEVLDIVCGAPNCRKGLKVIVAQVGCQLPEITIKEAKIRGVESHGMLCSLKELSISESLLDNDSPSLRGIEELDDSFAVGETDILNKLGYQDTIFDVSIYANRPDCLSVFGMAKEIAAIVNRGCNLPSIEEIKGTATKMQVSSTSPNCPYYLARIIKGLTIKDSPKWLQSRLRSMGIKVINNVVDISNYVMLETGQPLHFFDLRSIPSQSITVIDDYEGIYQALDGNDYQIQKGDIMISTGDKPIGIAGIMGGEGSKVLDDTTDIIIESALFDSAQIRRSANRLGLQTEAAMRFAKGLEPLAQRKAMQRATQLLKEYADAQIIEETVCAGSLNYQEREIEENLAHLNKLLGKQFTMAEVVAVFERLALNPRVDGEKVRVTIPSYRHFDLKIAEDLDEEVIRLSNFDDLEATLPLLDGAGFLNQKQQHRRFLRHYLVNQGFNEVVSYTLVSQTEKEATLFNIGESVELQAPLSDARRYIRTSLFSSLLGRAQYNLDHGNTDLKLFELSSVYNYDTLQEHLAILIQGDYQKANIISKALKADFYILKALIYELLDNLGLSRNRLNIKALEDSSLLHPYRSAVLEVESKELAYLGQIHPQYLDKVKDIYYAEINLSMLEELSLAQTKAIKLNRFPSIERDLSILISKDITAASLLKEVRKTGGKLLKEAKISDLYTGCGIEAGQQSMMLSLEFNSAEKTLLAQEVDEVIAKIIKQLEKEFKASLR